MEFEHTEIRAARRRGADHAGPPAGAQRDQLDDEPGAACRVAALCRGRRGPGMPSSPAPANARSAWAQTSRTCRPPTARAATARWRASAGPRCRSRVEAGDLRGERHGGGRRAALRGRQRHRDRRGARDLLRHAREGGAGRGDGTGDTGAQDAAGGGAAHDAGRRQRAHECRARAGAGAGGRSGAPGPVAGACLRGRRDDQGQLAGGDGAQQARDLGEARTGGSARRWSTPGS